MLMVKFGLSQMFTFSVILTSLFDVAGTSERIVFVEAGAWDSIRTSTPRAAKTRQLDWGCQAIDPRM